MASKTNLSVVIDIGTSKMAALAGRATGEGKLEILAVAKAPSKGIKRGVVFNLDEAADAIHQVLERLEDQLEEEIRVVNVAYAGQQMKTIDFRASRFTSGDGIVTRYDIDELYNEAKNVELKEGYTILKVVPKTFLIDGETEELCPVGSTGRKVEADFKIVVVAQNYLVNLQRVFDKVGVELGEVIHSSLAVSEAVLTDDEREMGVIVLDIGAGTTNMAVFQDNVLLHTAVIPFGGSVVTNDIKEGCSIFLKKAELLKIKYGQAMGDFADERKVVTIAGKNGWEPRDISFKSLAYIIQARLEEIIECVYTQIERSGIEGSLGSGIVLTGGTSNLENIVSLVKFKTAMDARKAHSVIHPVNRKEEMQDAGLLTALGALKLMLSNSETHEQKGKRKGKGRKQESKIVPMLKGVFQGALNLFEDDNEDVELN